MTLVQFKEFFGSLDALTEEDAMRVRKFETKIHWHEFIVFGLSQCNVDYSYNFKLIWYDFVVDIILIYVEHSLLPYSCLYCALVFHVLSVSLLRNQLWHGFASFEAHYLSFINKVFSHTKHSKRS